MIPTTRRGVLGLGLTTMAGLAAASTATAAEPDPTTATLNLGTYNIFSSEHEDRFPDNTWDSRRLAVGRIIRQRNNNPDILAIQEGQVAAQVDDLVDTLGRSWSHHVTTTDLSPRAVLWRIGMFEPLDQGEVEIMGDDIDGYAGQRFGTFVRLRHLATGGQLLVLNVHLPTGSSEELQAIRHSSANRIADLAEQWSTQYGDIPIVAMGDFNNYFDTVIGGLPSAPRTMVDRGFQETFHAAPPEARMNPDSKSKLDIVNARTGVGEDGSKRLDYIFVRPAQQARVVDWRMIVNLREGSDVDLRTPVPSDHHPVTSRVRFSWG
ncbi:MAG TPA: endonuclease/exonuclease/phosphatase family protein [Bacillota bacterium]|nr:endonuclease/exonuclease/phosphatase family protein [Bacillota bacterium]